MTGHPLDRVLHHLPQLIYSASAYTRSDSQLLQRFVQTREEAAFATLVERHGPMVLGVCRRILGNTPDADDAFQATFLILVRKAKSLHLWGSLASWLHGVAYRTALKARSQMARRRHHERQAASAQAVEVMASDTSGPELRQVLDQEVSQLPAK
jgi:RNA polymerase sigma-70 factor (ECF subfamily)